MQAQKAATKVLPKGSVYEPKSVADCRAAARYTLYEPDNDLVKQAKYKPHSVTDIVTCDVQVCSHTDNGKVDGVRCKLMAYLGDLCAHHLNVDFGLEIKRASIRVDKQDMDEQWGFFATRGYGPY